MMAPPGHTFAKPVARELDLDLERGLQEAADVAVGLVHHATDSVAASPKWSDGNVPSMSIGSVPTSSMCEACQRDE
jgi:hypothetical protein